MIYLLIILFIISCAYIDVEHFKDKDFVEDHTSRVVQRSLYCLSLLFISFNIFLSSIILFALLFDLCINILWGKPIFYLGSVSKWDLFWKKHKHFYFLTKGILVLILIWIIL